MVRPGRRIRPRRPASPLLGGAVGGAIRERPERIGPYLQLADVYKNRGQLDDAERLLSEGLRAAPGDPALRLAHSDVQVARLRRAITAWDRKARERPDDGEAAAKLARLTRLLADYEAATVAVGRGGDAGKRPRWALWRNR